MIMKKLFLACLSFSLAFVSGAFAADTNLTVDPVMSLTGEKALKSENNSGNDIMTVRVSNNSAEPTRFKRFEMRGKGKHQYRIVGGTCAVGQTLAAESDCTVDVAFQPVKSGTKMARLVVVTNTGRVSAFFSNEEDINTKAKRRVAPVLLNTNLGTTIPQLTANYQVSWSVMGYADSYESYFELFQCAAGTDLNNASQVSVCLSNAPIVLSGVADGSAVTNANWQIYLQEATVQPFIATFDTAALGSNTAQPIIARFFVRAFGDKKFSENYVSLVVPGNNGVNYVRDSAGRALALALQ